MTISITSTANSKVFEPTDELKAHTSVPWDWNNVLLIEESTLRAIRADALGYKSALEELNFAQKELNMSAVEINSLSQKLREAAASNAIPWYESPVLWGSIGFVIGAVGSTALFVAVTK